MSVSDHAAKLALWSFALGVVTISLQWFPALPLKGAQLADFLFLVAAAAMVVSRRQLIELARVDQLWIALFAGGAVVSAVVNGGSYLKLLGHLELAFVLIMAASLSLEEANGRRLRQALIWAALLAAVTGLVGALLFFAGHESALLNHYGDLLPGSYPRIRGTCLKANMLATILATGLILLHGEDKSSRLGRWRYAVAGVLVVALLFTFSRTWLTLGAGYLVLRALEKRSAHRTVLAAMAVAIVTLLLLVSARYTILLEPTRFWDVASSSEPGTRWVIWGDALETVKSHLLFGRGPGSPATASGWSAHLVWLNLWAVLGIVPLCGFAIGIYRALGKYRAEAALAVAVGVIVLDGFARDVEDMRHLWVLMGLLIGSRAKRELGKRTQRDSVG